MLGAAAATVAIAAAFVRTRPQRVVVAGSSMEPTLEAGEWAIAVAPRRLRRGAVVVVEHQERPGFEMVKRIVAGPGDRIGDRLLESGEWWVEGDRPDASTDSRTFGPVPASAVTARLVAVYGPGMPHLLRRRSDVPAPPTM